MGLLKYKKWLLIINWLIFLKFLNMQPANSEGRCEQPDRTRIAVSLSGPWNESHWCPSSKVKVPTSTGTILFCLKQIFVMKIMELIVLNMCFKHNYVSEMTLCC